MLITDPVQISIIGGIVTLLLAVFGSITTVILAKIAKQGVEAVKKVDLVAVKTQEVKEVLAETTKKADEKLEKIHTLVNSNMGAQLKISAVALRRLAEYTKNSEDIKAAVVAEKLLEDHVEKQDIVDKIN